MSGEQSVNSITNQPDLQQQVRTSSCRRGISAISHILKFIPGCWSKNLEFPGEMILFAKEKNAIFHLVQVMVELSVFMVEGQVISKVLLWLSSVPATTGRTLWSRGSVRDRSYGSNLCTNRNWEISIPAVSLCCKRHH